MDEDPDEALAEEAARLGAEVERLKDIEEAWDCHLQISGGRSTSKLMELLSAAESEAERLKGEVARLTTEGDKQRAALACVIEWIACCSNIREMPVDCCEQHGNIFAHEAHVLRIVEEAMR